MEVSSCGIEPPEDRERRNLQYTRAGLAIFLSLLTTGMIGGGAYGARLTKSIAISGAAGMLRVKRAGVIAVGSCVGVMAGWFFSLIINSAIGCRVHTIHNSAQVK